MHKTVVIILSVSFFTLMSCMIPANAAAPTRAQGRKIVGVVTDSLTGERMPFVNVWSKKYKRGVTTELDGSFEMQLVPGTVLDITAMGYSPRHIKAVPGDTLRILLAPAETELAEVVIKPKKKKYSKKNNPAVELMQRVRRDRDIHNPVTQMGDYNYDRYDKMIIAVNNYNGYLPGEDGKVKGRMKALAELVDTGVWTGKRILDVSMKEKLSTRITRSDGLDKEIVQAQRSNGIDKGLDADYSRAFFEDVLREVNVYDNDIAVLRNRFVSPLSPIAADYYMFHIEDTVSIGNERCVELSFAPHNPESMGFNGKLYIPADDSVKYVRRVMMRLPKATNVNHVQSLVLSQTYERDSLGMVHKSLDDMVLEMNLVGAFGEIYTSRQSRYENRSYEPRKDLEDYYERIGSSFTVEGADEMEDSYWPSVRLLPLSAAERKLSVKESPFRQIPVLYWTAKVIEVIFKGYLPTGKHSPFDFGPIDSFVSYNACEGLRLKVGGMTTANLNDHWFARGYVAYGFKDRKWKYKGELEYSFLKKKYHSREFPVNGIRASYSYDVNKLGQHYLTNSASNLLNSIKRLDSNLMTYERVGSLEYNIEWRNNLSFQAAAFYRHQESSRYVPFLTSDGKFSPGYTQNSLRLHVRYAPGEKFFQTYNERRNINRDAISLVLAHEIGPKGWFGSEFMLNKTEFCLQKRFWFSAIGYADIIFKTAKLWNQVQFPALLWQNANVAYTVQSETFSLLNPMEFAMDEYASLDLNYNFNGLLFNRIPLVKKARLREVFSFKSFAGHLTKKNNPAYNDNLYRFPAGSWTQPMGKTPYMEIGVGIDNILTLIRLDYIWRLSYRDKPGAPNSGFRFSFHFDF